MVKLFCAIVGGAGSAFPVVIDAGETVGDLKKAIKVEKPDTIKGEADKLQLFLAQTEGGAWLPDDDDLDKMLYNPCDTSKLQELRSSWKLKREKDPPLFGPNVCLGEDVVHVLVVVPEGAGGSVSETSATSKMIQEIHESTVLTKRKVYVHSRVSTTEYDELVGIFGIRVMPLRQNTRTAARSSVEGFRWEKRPNEDQQKDEYRKYVDSNLHEVLQEKRLCVFGVENGTDVLRVVVEGSNIELRGRTDLLILSDVVMESADYAHDLPGVKMLIEVKKKVERKSVFQAMSELIALDLIAIEPVFAVLTDFNKDWRFFWVAEKQDNYTCVNKVNITDPGEGFELIRQLLNSPASVDIDLPLLEGPVKRRKLQPLLSISEASGTGGIRESIERYYDIASVLGPDLDMARSVARQVTRSIPTLSYFS